MDHLLRLQHDSDEDVELQLGSIQLLSLQHNHYEVVDLELSLDHFLSL